MAVPMDSDTIRVSWAAYEVCGSDDAMYDNATFDDSDPRQNGGRRLTNIQFQTSVNGSDWIPSEDMTHQDSRFQASRNCS